MAYFGKINTVSILFAFLFFAALELMVNTYRLSRLLNVEVSVVVDVSIILLGIWLAGGVIVCYLFITRWLEKRKSDYFTVILWFPYFILMTSIFVFLFPIHHPADDPAPVLGFVIIGGLIVYPAILAFIICISHNVRKR
ncbi:hypothetical protein [Halobacillus halophilus]|uniref:hypothetical protein n=1 Tax=Halobacillus halophilus TaxID=1570 RepID=UPI001CD357F2|nr:hypothetical protein [Halobacillus halophilus]MCA1013030.1 hypothetical protein [Halobacillus halophilus]